MTEKIATRRLPFFRAWVRLWTIFPVEWTPHYVTRHQTPPAPR